MQRTAKGYDMEVLVIGKGIDRAVDRRSTEATTMFWRQVVWRLLCAINHKCGAICRGNQRKGQQDREALGLRPETHVHYNHLCAATQRL